VVKKLAPLEKHRAGGVKTPPPIKNGRFNDHPVSGEMRSLQFSFSPAPAGPNKHIFLITEKNHGDFVGVPPVPCQGHVGTRFRAGTSPCWGQAARPYENIPIWVLSWNRCPRGRPLFGIARHPAKASAFLWIQSHINKCTHRFCTGIFFFMPDNYNSNVSWYMKVWNIRLNHCN
jgi:hypothetical protein